MCEQAVNVFRDMEKVGIEPNLTMLNLLINAFSVAGKYLEAFAVFDYMREVVSGLEVSHRWCLTRRLVSH